MSGRFEDQEKLTAFKYLQDILPTRYLLVEIFGLTDEEARLLLQEMQDEVVSRSSSALADRAVALGISRAASVIRIE